MVLETLSAGASYYSRTSNGSNTFGTVKISSRQGEFEPMKVDYSARSGGFIGIFLDFL